MDKYRFPLQKPVIMDKPCTREMLAGICTQVFRSTSPFTGFIRIVDGDGTVLFLFFLRGEHYAAGRFNGRRPLAISISEFFAVMDGGDPSEMLVSLHETDPVLLKMMLVFLQNEPTAKAPVWLFDLEGIIRQIQADAGDAVVVLEKEKSYSFFFFKGGRAVIGHRGDGETASGEGVPLDEQLLVYAFQSGAAQVTAYVYRDIATEPASDGSSFSREALLELARGGSCPAAFDITVTVVAGLQKGKQFNVRLPCTLGRKDCDIVVNDARVSRLHAEFRREQGKLVIVDRGSTGGTFVNDQPVTRKELSPDDIITIGDTHLKIVS